MPASAPRADRQLKGPAADCVTGPVCGTAQLIPRAVADDFEGPLADLPQDRRTPPHTDYLPGCRAGRKPMTVFRQLASAPDPGCRRLTRNRETHSPGRDQGALRIAVLITGSPEDSPDDADLSVLQHLDAVRLAGRDRITVERQLQGHQLTSMHPQATAPIDPVSNPHRHFDHRQSA